MYSPFDLLRLISVVLALCTIYFILRFWKRYPLFWPQFSLIIAYMLHGIIYYGVMLVDRSMPFVAEQFFANWEAVLRLHSFTTWFFVALLYFRGHRKYGR